MIAGLPTWPGTTGASGPSTRDEEMHAGGTLGMTAAEARGRLRAIGARSQNLAGCPACHAAKGTPCDADPAYFHAPRFQAAAAAYASRRGQYPEDFDRVLALICAAHPVPGPCEAQETADGKTILWRAHHAGKPWLGRCSYWTHDRRWADFYLCIAQLGSPGRIVLWRAEARITCRNSYYSERLRMTTGRSGQLDRLMRQNPGWPGRSWLIFTGHPQDGYMAYPEHNMTQYVWCGKHPVKAEALGPLTGHACGRSAERAAAQRDRRRDSPCRVLTAAETAQIRVRGRKDSGRHAGGQKGKPPMTTTSVKDATATAEAAKNDVDRAEADLASGGRGVTASALHKIRDTFRHAELAAQGTRRRAEDERRAARLVGLKKIAAAVDTAAADSGIAAALADALAAVAAACDRIRSLAADHDEVVAGLVAAAADLGAEPAAPGGPRSTPAHVAVRGNAISHGRTTVSAVSGRVEAAIRHAVAGDVARAAAEVQAVTIAPQARPDHLLRGPNGQLIALTGPMHPGIAAQLKTGAVRRLSGHDIDLYLAGDLL